MLGNTTRVRRERPRRPATWALVGGTVAAVVLIGVVALLVLGGGTTEPAVGDEVAASTVLAPAEPGVTGQDLSFVISAVFLVILVGAGMVALAPSGLSRRRRRRLRTDPAGVSKSPHR